jgi:primosomal protein N' (replication factor Y)
MSNWLFIHPRRGLFQLTICRNCKYIFECANCDAKLTTYRQSGDKLELVCHQCQSYYHYPAVCPKCHSNQIVSRYGGIDELEENLTKLYPAQIVRLDKVAKPTKSTVSVPQSQINQKLQSNSSPTHPKLSVPTSSTLQSPHFIKSQSPRTFYLTTRIFDPSLDYAKFSKIIFIQADNLLASPDYLVSEEVAKDLTEIFLQITDQTELIFDSLNPDNPFFTNFKLLNKDHPVPISPLKNYIQFLEKELHLRKTLAFPPYVNLLLFTSQETTKQKSLQLMENIKQNLSKPNLPGISVSEPYPARFLKRKNMYSHHVLLKFPRQYSHYTELKKLAREQSELYRVQIRLNPRHLF